MNFFVENYEVHKQPKFRTVGGKKLRCQYGSCSFIPRRHRGDDALALSYCQKGRLDSGWCSYWFYVKTPCASYTRSNGMKVSIWPLASVMNTMAPKPRVEPKGGDSAAKDQCHSAFAQACKYSCGRDLVEEWVAADYSPLARNRRSFEIEAINIPVFGSSECVPCPKIRPELGEDETGEDFIAKVVDKANAICDEISVKEYLSRRSAAGDMPRLNRIFERMGLTYGPHTVPSKVLQEVTRMAAEDDEDADSKTKKTGKKRKGGAESSQTTAEAKLRLKGPKIAASGGELRTPIESRSGSHKTLSGQEASGDAKAEMAESGGTAGSSPSHGDDAATVFKPMPSAFSDASSSETSRAREASPPAEEMIEEIEGSPPRDDEGLLDEGHQDPLPKGDAKAAAHSTGLEDILRPHTEKGKELEEEAVMAAATLGDLARRGPGPSEPRGTKSFYLCPGNLAFL